MVNINYVGVNMYDFMCGYLSEININKLMKYNIMVFYIVIDCIKIIIFLINIC